MKQIRAEYVCVPVCDYITGDFEGFIERPVKTLNYQEMAGVYTVETYRHPFDEYGFDIPDFTGVYATLEEAENAYFKLSS